MNYLLLLSMKIKEFTVQKELLLNLGNFSNIKIITSITSSDDDFQGAWKTINEQIQQQEDLERSLRLPTPKPPEMEKGWKPVEDMPF